MYWYLNNTSCIAKHLTWQYRVTVFVFLQEILIYDKNTTKHFHTDILKSETDERQSPL